jgi:uncharacterized membrane protein (DUF106 family)
MILKIEKLLPQQPKPMVVHISVEIPIFQHPWLVLSHPKNDASVISTNRSNNLVAKPRNIEIHETTQPVTKKKNSHAAIIQVSWIFHHLYKSLPSPHRHHVACGC